MPWRAEKIGDARRAFERQQRALDQQPAAEAGERAVGADDAVAGNDDRQRVRAVREAHGARSTGVAEAPRQLAIGDGLDRKSTRLNSSHLVISYAVFCLK